MKKYLVTITALALTVMSGLAGDIKLSLGDKGVVIDAGSAGKYTVEAPVLDLGDSKEKPVFDAKTGVAQYASGVTFTFKVDGGTIDCSYDNLPAEARSLSFFLMIPIRLKEGGKYSFGTGELKEFPAEKDKQFIVSGARGKLNLLDASGDGFSLDVPANWAALQDNRVFNWNVFCYHFLRDLKAHPNERQFVIKVAPFDLTVK